MNWFKSFEPWEGGDHGMAGAPGLAKGVPGMSVDPNTGWGAQECQGVSGRAWGSQEWQGVSGMAGIAQRQEAPEMAGSPRNGR